MTIANIEQFNRRLASLLRYYHKPVDELIQEIWFSACDAVLSDEEFFDAIALTLRKKDFLPPIDVFIKSVKGGELLADFQAGEVWEKIVMLSAIATSSREEHKIERLLFVDSLAPAYRHALDRLGGLAAIGLVPVENLHWKQKEFISCSKNFQQVEELRKEGNERASAAALGGDGAVKALPQSTVDVVDVGGNNEPYREREREFVPNRGFSNIGDLLF